MARPAWSKWSSRPLAAAARRRRRLFPAAAERLERRALLSGVPAQWSVRGSGGGGALFSPSIDPASASDLFVSSDMGQIFRSTDSGASWQELNFGQIQGGHESQVQFTEDPKTLYAVDYTSVNGGNTSRPSKSTDGGATWTPLANDPTGGSTFKLFANPGNHNDLLVSDYTHLYNSTDGGTTWSTVYTTANANAGLHVAGVFFNGLNVYAGTSDGLLVSADGGATFAASTAGGIPAGQAILSLAGASQNGTTRLIATTRASADVYAGIQGYDYQYPDSVYSLVVGQSSWTSAMTGISTSAYTTDVAMAPGNTSVAYLAGGSTAGTPTVYKTTDGGAHWSPVFLTLNNQNIATGWSGAGGDRGWTYGETALGLDVSPTDPNHVIFTDLGFAHQSTDGGTDWSQLYVNRLDQNPEGSLTPPGKNYRDSGLDNTSSWDVTWADKNNVIVGNSDIGGTHSTDGGTSFAHFSSGNTYNSTYWTVVAPTTGTAYAATSSVHDMYESTHLTDASIDGGNGAVLFSADKGATWQTLHNFNHPVVWVALDPNNASRLYASVVSSTAGGIYVTNDLQDGASSVWTELPAPPRTQGHPLDIRVLNDGSVVATFSGRLAGSPSNFTDSSGVFLYNPTTQAWTDVSAPNMHYWTTDLTVDPSDATQSTWFVGVYSGWGGSANNKGGLYETTDRGKTWTQLLSLDGVSSVTFNPSNTNELFVATESEGLWYSANIHATTPTIGPVASYPFRQPERIFFNPNNTNEIWVTSFGGGVLVGNTAPPQNGTLQFSSASYSVVENVSTATITVTRTNGTTGAVSVHYATSDGTAHTQTDYAATSGTLNFADGQTSATFTVPVLGDTAVDGTVTVNLALSSPTGGATLGSPSTAVLNLVDVPGALQLSAANYSVSENANYATITVTRTIGDGGRVTVDYATSDGSARQGVDYTKTSGTLTFLDGQVTNTFSVPILHDPADDGPETVFLTLTNPTGGATLGNQTTGTLTIAEGAGSLQFSSATYSAAETSKSATINVTRTGGNGGAVSIHYATSDGSATAGTDYTATSGTLNFADGQNSASFTVPILVDPATDGTETVNLTLSAPTGGAALGTPNSAVLNIVDPPGTLQFSAPTFTATEGGPAATITVTRTGGDGGAVSVQYATSNGTAIAGADYTSTTGTLNFADGQASATFTVPVLNDGVDDGTETVNLALSKPTGGASIGSQGTAVLNIKDAPGALEFSASAYSTLNGGGPITITVTRSGGDGGPVTVHYATSDGTAKAGTNYTATSGTLNFVDGQISAIFGIPIQNDPSLTTAKNLTLTLSAASGGAALGSPATSVVNITGPPGTLQFSAPTYTAVEGGAAAKIVVTRTGGTGGAVSVHYATSDGTAKAGTDYTAASGTLNFADGQSTASFTVPVLNDGADDGTETVNLILSAPTGGASLGAQGAALLSIADVPGTLQFGATAASTPQNAGSITVLVVRDGGNGGAVSINYATMDGTARAGLDYAASSGTLNFADGQSIAPLVIPIFNDPGLRANASFSIALSSPTGGAGLGAQGTISVTVTPVPHSASDDFNGDGLSDVGVYRSSSAQWFVQLAGWTPPVLGASNLLIPVPGDYDHVGYAEPAVFRPSTGEWIVQGPTGVHVVAKFGGLNLFDIPVPGDYDGVGYTEPAVFRPSTSEWFVLGPGGGHPLATFGAPNLYDIPAPGDYDGTGHTEPAVFRPSTAQWFVLGPSGGELFATFGAPNLYDIPAPGDYDGIGHTEPAVFRPSTSQWFAAGPQGGHLFTVFGGSGLTDDIPLETSIGSLAKLGVVWRAKPASISATAVAAPLLTAPAPQSAAAPRPVAPVAAAAPATAPANLALAPARKLPAVAGTKHSEAWLLALDHLAGHVGHRRRRI